MPKKPLSGSPRVGQRIYLGGDIKWVGQDNLGFQQVTVRLDKYDYPITITWSEPDGEKIVAAEQLEKA